MNLEELFTQYVPLVESEMRAFLSAPGPSLDAYYGMFHYHLGWVDEHFAPAHVQTGKRIRPMLCLLACQSSGGDIRQALPAAAAIELVHNFSLIHDDIQDSSLTRRGRPSVWALWGIPQAINAGDGMFALAHLAMDRLVERHVLAERILDAQSILDRACLALTQGQYLDLEFESHESVSVDEYMTMVTGKTAALIGASAAIGATLAGSKSVLSYETFGRELGLAFQIQDDVLGIWGDEALTGKSIASDLARHKKTLPVLYALERSDKLRELYAAREVNVSAAIAELDKVCARMFAEKAARDHHARALAALRDSAASGNARDALHDLAASLLNRAA